MPEGGEKDQFNVYLRAEVIRAIKHAAIDRGEKLGEFVERIFQDYLRRQRADKPDKPDKKAERP